MDANLALEDESSEMQFGTTTLAQTGPRWPHVLISAFILGLALALWCVVQWRRTVDDEYARVQLYEDRPFAFADDHVRMDVSEPQQEIPLGSWHVSSHDVDSASSDVQATQRLIRDALHDDDSPRERT